MYIPLPEYKPSPLMDLAPLASALDSRQRAQQYQTQLDLKQRENAEEKRRFELGNARSDAQLGLAQNADRRAAEMAPLERSAKQAQIAASNAALAQARAQTPEARAQMAAQYGIDVNTPEGRQFVVTGQYAPRQEFEVKTFEEGQTPYRVDRSGNATPIPLPDASGAPGPKALAREAEIRKEFINQPGVKEFQTVRQGYQNVHAAAKDPSAAGDLSMIFAYMKILDPNSVVREQEFANAQNAAGVPDRIRNVYNRIMAGERLNPAQRADFIAQAEKLYANQERQYQSIKKQYGTIAEGSRARPDMVTLDYGIAPDPKAPTQGAQPGAAPPRQQAAPTQGQPSAPVRVRSPEEADRLPPGTPFMTPDGRVKVR